MFRFLFLTVISLVISRCHGVDDPVVVHRGNDDISKAIIEGSVINIETKNADKSLSDIESHNHRRHIRAVTPKRAPAPSPAPLQAVESTINEDLMSENIERFLRQANGEPKKLVCYLNNIAPKRRSIGRFTAEDVDPFFCTHVIVASAALDVSNNLIRFLERENLEPLMRRKRFNQNLKIMLSVGGPQEPSNRFSAIFGDRRKRAELIQNVVKFLSDTSLDGIDIDWQYSDERTAADRENYKLAIKEFREEFDKVAKRTTLPRYLLSITLPILEEHIDKGYDLPAISSYVDFMSVLAYNYHDSWEPRVNHHASIYYQQEENEYQYDKKLTINHTVSYLIAKGADARKLVLGVPTFGRTYTLMNPTYTLLGAPAEGPGEEGEITQQRGYLAYYEICRNINEGGWTIVNVKKNAMGPHAFNGYEWVSYDSMNSARLKGKFANEKGLGGLMFYTIDMDDFKGTCHNQTYFPIIKAAKEEFLVGQSVMMRPMLPMLPTNGGNIPLPNMFTSQKHEREAVNSTINLSSRVTTPTSFELGPVPPKKSTGELYPLDLDLNNLDGSGGQQNTIDIIANADKFDAENQKGQKMQSQGGKFFFFNPVTINLYNVYKQPGNKAEINSQKTTK